jgi:hypothetical protein
MGARIWLNQPVSRPSGSRSRLDRPAAQAPRPTAAPWPPTAATHRCARAVPRSGELRGNAQVLPLAGIYLRRASEWVAGPDLAADGSAPIPAPLPSARVLGAPSGREREDERSTIRRPVSRSFAPHFCKSTSGDNAKASRRLLGRRPATALRLSAKGTFRTEVESGARTVGPEGGAISVYHEGASGCPG